MEPTIDINYLAVLACVVASMPLGAFWFGPGFGKAWAAEMGYDPNMPKPDGKFMAKAMSITLLGNLLIAFVLTHSALIWRPSTWGGSPDMADWIYGLNAAIWTWLGFFLPMQMNRVAWEMKRWKLVGINASHDLVRLTLFGMILAYWR